MHDDFDAPSWRDDILCLLFMAFMVVCITALTTVGLILSDHFIDMLGRMGLSGAGVSFVGNVVGFGITVFVTLSILGRIVNGDWWWRK